jgi:hypothetical protein
MQMKRVPTHDDVALARVKLDAQRTASREGVSMAVYVWDGKPGAPRYDVRPWSDGQWDDPGIVDVAHPGTIEQGG